MSDAGEATLIGRIYEAAQDPEQWGDALRGIGVHVGLDCWTLLRSGRQSKEVEVFAVGGERVSADAEARYRQYYGSLDPRVRLARNRPPGEIQFCHAYFDNHFVSCSEFYQDFLIPEGLRYTAGALAYRSESTDFFVGLLRGPERGRFGDRERGVLQRLMPHLAGSLRFMTHLEEVLGAKQVLAKALEMSGTAIIELDRSALIRFTNDLADRLLVRGDVVRGHKGALEVTDPGSRACFAACLARCIDKGFPETLTLPSPVEPFCRYTMLLTWLGPKTSFNGVTARDRIVCLINRLNPRRVATVGQLMGLFSMTPAEARLARAIGAGETLNDYAADNGLKTSTVRTQLKSVFAKTGTSRQSALARLISGIPAAR